MKPSIQGIIPATITPMHPNGEINYGFIPDQVAYLKESGVSALFINGTTGEFASLTMQERIKLAEAYQKIAEHVLPIIIHVGHNCILDAQQLTVHASQIGAAAVSFAPPSYFKLDDVNTLIKVCDKIMAKTPHMPFYYYHIPSITGVYISIKDFLIQADRQLPQLAGIKYTFEQIDTFLDCQLSFPERFTMMFGRDEMMLMGLVSGAKTFVGSTYNFAAPLYLKIQKAFKENDLETAQKLQHKVIQLIHILNQHGGGIRFGKIVMKLMNMDCGPVRLPLASFDESELDQVKQSLTEIGFFQW